MRLITTLIWALLLGFLTARAAEVIPPAPRDHFNDYAGIVERGTAQQLQAELTQFERDTSNQILVAIYPRMQSDSSIEDYTVRVAQAWRVGQAGRKNGTVLFVFSEDRKLYVQVGYGLEGTLPDALCKQIIENEIIPRFRNGDFTGGVAAGTHALMAATRGEYRGTGRTATDGRRRNTGFGFGTLFVFAILFIVVRSFFRRNVLYTRRGRVSPWIGHGGWSGGSWGGGSGGWSGGGGGGGSFSGGGGSFGGGGAGGSW